MSECLKCAEFGDVDVDVDIDPVCSEDHAYPDNECEYYTAFYLCTISEHVFPNFYYCDYVLFVMWESMQLALNLTVN